MDQDSTLARHNFKNISVADSAQKGLKGNLWEKDGSMGQARPSGTRSRVYMVFTEMQNTFTRSF